MKSSAIALSAVLKKPRQMKEAYQGSLARSKSSEALGTLSIFKKPRLAPSSTVPSLMSDNVVYNGIGGTTKVLQSDLKESSSMDSFWMAPKKQENATKKKKLSPFLLGK